MDTSVDETDLVPRQRGAYFSRGKVGRALSVRAEKNAVVVYFQQQHTVPATVPPRQIALKRRSSLIPCVSEISGDSGSGAAVFLTSRDRDESTSPRRASNFTRGFVVQFSSHERSKILGFPEKPCLILADFPRLPRRRKLFRAGRFNFPPFGLASRANDFADRNAWQLPPREIE